MEILNIKVVTFKSLATSSLPLSPAHFLFHIRTNNRRAFGVGTLTERLYMFWATLVIIIVCNWYSTMTMTMTMTEAVMCLFFGALALKEIKE